MIFPHKRTLQSQIVNNDWILSLDADEIASDELKDEIKKIRPKKY